MQLKFGPAEWGISILLATTWGSSFFLIAVAVDDIAPVVISFWRTLIGGITLVLLPSARERVELRHWPRIALLGLVWMALPFWLFPLAEQTVASSVAGMINGGLPVVMALVTAIWVRRVPSTQRVRAIIIGFIGLLVVAAPSVLADSADGDAIADLRGVSFLLAALLCYALGANIARPLQAMYSPARLMMRVQLAAAAISSPIALLGRSDSQFTLSGFSAVLLLGVLGTGVAFVAFGTLLARTGMSRAMIPTYFTPVVGLLLGSLLGNERIAGLSVIGMLIVTISAWMTSKPDERDVTFEDVRH